MISSIYRIWKVFGVHPLTRSDRVASMKRFIRWQIGSRLLGAPALVPFIGETVMVVEPGMTGATGNVYCGLHEFEDMALLLHVLRMGDRFVETGAKIFHLFLRQVADLAARCISSPPFSVLGMSI